MIDLFDLGNEIGEVGLESGGIMVVKDVEIDAVSSAGEESGSVAFPVDARALVRAQVGERETSAEKLTYPSPA